MEQKEMLKYRSKKFTPPECFFVLATDFTSPIAEERPPDSATNELEDREIPDFSGVGLIKEIFFSADPFI